MAIKEPKNTDKSLEAMVPGVGVPQPAGPIALTADETASLYDSLATPPQPLSPEIKSAIANYKRIKALRIR